MQLPAEFHDAVADLNDGAADVLVRRAVAGVALEVHELPAGADRFVEQVEAAFEDRGDGSGFRSVAAAPWSRLMTEIPKWF